MSCTGMRAVPEVGKGKVIGAAAPRGAREEIDHAYEQHQERNGETGKKYFGSVAQLACVFSLTNCTVGRRATAPSQAAVAAN